jgi:hypothetical protein
MGRPIKHLADLSSLLDTTPSPPQELQELLNKSLRKGIGAAKQAPSKAWHEIESLLHARLFLYRRAQEFAVQQQSGVSEGLIKELDIGALRCQVLLLWVQLRVGASKSALYTVGQLLETEEVAVLQDESRHFLVDLLIECLLLSDNLNLLDDLQENALFRDDSRMARFLGLAKAIADYDAHQPQGTISQLKDVIKGGGETAIVAYYALAQVYCELDLPYEERESYTEWKKGMVDIHKCTLAELAGRMHAQQRNGIEQAILTGIKRWLRLEAVSGNKSGVDMTVKEFCAAAYKADMAEFETLTREDGYDCKMLNFNIQSHLLEAKSEICRVLLHSQRKNACVIVHNQENEPFKLPLDKSVAIDEIRERLENDVAGFGVSVIPEIICENGLASRKWICCEDLNQPGSSLAIGFLPAGQSQSVIYAQAVVFEIKLNVEKRGDWAGNLAQMLERGFDAQKARSIRDTLLRIVQGLAPLRLEHTEIDV